MKEALELPQKEEHLGRGYLEKILRAEFWSKLQIYIQYGS